MTASPIRLLLVDDHAAFRVPLALALGLEPDLLVVGQSGSLAEARAVLPQLAGQVDVALIDLQLPDGDGIDFVRDLRAGNAQGQTLVLTADADKLHHAIALEAGAAGILSKAAHPTEIIETVRRVVAGGSAQSTQEIIELMQLAAQERELTREVAALLERLTPREREVLVLLVEGLDNKAIAERLFISPETARSHVVRLLAKLNVETRLQAAIFAIRHGLGTPD